MRIRNVVLLIIIGIVALTSNAQPKPNVYDTGNQWTITGYDDTSTTHARLGMQTLCFLPYVAVGTSIQGVWYSTSFPNWRGRYDQEGDRILMHGEWTPTGHDSMVIELFSGPPEANEGAGQWTEWLESSSYGSTVGFANARLRRTGKCIMPGIPDVTKVSRAELEKLALELSGKVKPRMRRDGKPAQSPIDPEQVPLEGQH